MGPLFGILAAFTWGGGDFVGGLASRRLPTLLVVLLSQAAALALIVPVAVAGGQPLPGATVLLQTAVAGLAGGAGIVSLYHGFAHGRISIVASIAGTLAALIPVGATIVGGEIPSPLRLVGFAGAIVAIVIVSMSGDSDAPRGTARAGGAAFGFAAGCAFATFSLIFSGVESTATVWLLAVLRIASVSALTAIVLGFALARRSAPGLEPIRPGAIPRDLAGRIRLALILVAAGSGDTLGNLFFFLSANESGVAVAAVFTSIAPVTTVLFAALVLGERVGPRQALGIALAAAATVAIALGGVV